MKTTQRGFSLIEIMVALAIVGIIAALAIPSYRQSIRKANRTDAKIILARLATLEERYYFTNNAYTGDFANLVTGTVSGNPVASDQGLYSVAVTLTGSGTGWSMVATAVGTQAADTDCATFTQTSLGAKTARKSDNSANASCW